MEAVQSPLLSSCNLEKNSCVQKVCVSRMLGQQVRKPWPRLGVRHWAKSLWTDRRTLAQQRMTHRLQD